MALYYNNANIAQSANVLINNKACNNVYYNNALVWKKSFNILTQASWSTVSQTTDGAGTPDNYGTARRNGDGSLHVSAFNGGRAGWAYWTLGPVSTRGYNYINIYIPISVSAGANGILVGNWYLQFVNGDGSVAQWLKNDSPPTIPTTYNGIVAAVNQYDSVYVRFGVQGSATGQGGTTEATCYRLQLE